MTDKLRQSSTADNEQAIIADQWTLAGEAADHIRSKTALRPKLGLVLGSGLGAFADELTEQVRLPYGSIPHFPVSSAEGHAGNLIVGKVNHVPVAAMQGRVHYYEGHSMLRVTFPMRVFCRMGIKGILLTNAAGGIGAQLTPGSLVVISDHINLQGTNALIGPNEERFGPRFPDMTEAYAKDWRAIVLEEGRKQKINIHQGIYAAVPGPSYETPAEIRFLKTIGADVVGMSTVAEVVVARHCGMKVMAISVVTNMAAGILDLPINHSEVLEIGRKVRDQFANLLKAIVPKLTA
jgi:purine-nucleoside phosphorylase